MRGDHNEHYLGYGPTWQPQADDTTGISADADLFAKGMLKKPSRD